MKTIFLLLLFLICAPCYAQKHYHYNSTRYSPTSFIVISSGLDGEVGNYSLFSKNPIRYTGSAFSKGLGLEVLKFIHFEAQYNYLMLSSLDSSDIRGSRLTGEMRLAFSSPIGNLEFGFGLFGSSLQHQFGFDKTNIYTNGYYISALYNYFIRRRVSLYLRGRSFEGVSQTQSIGSSNPQQSLSFGLGFKIWM